MAGDDVWVDVSVGRGATCFLGTQSQTKVYRSATGRAARQSVDARIATGAMLVSMPDPVSCFAESVFEQRQRFEMSTDASLIWLEWLTSGRRARGERWAMGRYQSFADVCVGDRLIFRDALRLDQSDGPIDSPHRMGGCDCFATLLLIGPRVAEHAAAILKWAVDQPAKGDGSVLFAVSPVGGGAVVRAAGPGAEVVGWWVRDRLKFLPELLGADPWERKW